MNKIYDKESTLKANIISLGSNRKIVSTFINGENVYNCTFIPYIEIPNTPVKKYGLVKFLFQNLSFAQLHKLLHSKYITATMTFNPDTSVVKCVMNEEDDSVTDWIVPFCGYGYIIPITFNIMNDNITRTDSALSIAYHKSPHMFEALLHLKKNDILILNHSRYIFKPNEHNYFQMM